jgi:uncharacterized protein YbcI
MRDASAASALQDVSTAMVALHKEQFGRGPIHARSDFAGANTLVCTLENALLPAEHAMLAMGEHQRVRESRMFFQVATADAFIKAVEVITNRHVRAFASALDPDADVVWEIFTFTPQHPEADGR